MSNSDDLDLKSSSLEPDDIDTLKKIVIKYFRIYDTRWSEKTAAFYFTMDSDKNKLEVNFEELRLELKSMGFLPRLSQDVGEYIIYVVRSPKVKKRNIWVNIILLILTIFTTTWAGTILWYGRTRVISNEFDIITPLLTPEVVLFGFLSFALPLMLILGAHESAHYLAAKRHKIDASLPYFIPLPPVPFILGTMGAFISMREPISNKKALLDIGAAGPIAGFLVSIPILIIGFTLEGMQTVTIIDMPENVFIFNEPLLFAGLRAFFPTPENTPMHPTVFAGWVGLFVTALNLLPGGQLDGGHIARALLGKNAKYLSLIVIFALFVLSFITGFFLWIFFAFLILLFGSSHPPPLNDISPLGAKRQAIGAFCMAMLLICIHYAPIIIETVPQYDLEFDCDNCDQVVDINGTAFYFIEVTNTADEEGKVEFDYNITSQNSIETNWSTDLQLFRPSGKQINLTKKFTLNSEQSFIIKLNVIPNEHVDYGEVINHNFNVEISGLATYTETFTVTTRVGTFDMNTQSTTKRITPGSIGNVSIAVKNLINETNNISLTYNITEDEQEGTDYLNWFIELDRTNLTLGPFNSTTFKLFITPPVNVTTRECLNLEIIGRSEQNSKIYDSIKLCVEIIPG
jgi:Zn-dependent protease